MAKSPSSKPEFDPDEPVLISPRFKDWLVNYMGAQGLQVPVGRIVGLKDAIQKLLVGGLDDGASGPQIRWGTGSPESAVTAPVGSIFLRTNGGASTTLYVKESGTGNTGWVAK